jgi:hypothetical protein
MIKDLAELKKLLKLCRAEGVKEIDVGTHRIVFGEKPHRSKHKEEEVEREPTPEEMAFYSVGGNQ